MKKFLVPLIAGCMCAPLWTDAHAAKGMTGTASISITSDTAASAKTMALGEARRQIIRDAVGPYCDRTQLDALISETTDSDLTPLIAKSKINNEQQSATTYSADITMTLERVAVQNWLNDNDIQNWLGDPTASNRVTVIVRITGGLNDWVELNSIARRADITLETRRMDPGRIVVEIPSGNRAMLTAMVRDAGWHYSDDNGILNIWK